EDTWARAFAPEVRPAIPGLDKIAMTDRRTAMKALAQESIALTLPEWLQLVTGEAEDKCASAALAAGVCLPIVFGELVDDDNDLSAILKHAAFPREEPAPRFRKWAAGLAADRTLDPICMRRRLWLSSLRGVNGPKTVKVAVAPSQ